MTAHNEYFLKRQIQLVLYSLKRRFGGTILIHHTLSSTTDPKTGHTTVQASTVRIPYAVILPVKIEREVERNISIISANKQMVMGGGFDTGTRAFIVERRDAPSLQVVKDDRIIYGDSSYSIESIEECDYSTAWILIGRKLVGESGNLSHTANSETNIVLGSDSGREA